MEELNSLENSLYQLLNTTFPLCFPDPQLHMRLMQYEFGSYIKEDELTLGVVVPGAFVQYTATGNLIFRRKTQQITKEITTLTWTSSHKLGFSEFDGLHEAKDSILLLKFGLSSDSNIFMVSFTGKLEEPKGSNIHAIAIYKLCTTEVQMVTSEVASDVAKVSINHNWKGTLKLFKLCLRQFQVPKGAGFAMTVSVIDVSRASLVENFRKLDNEMCQYLYSQAQWSILANVQVLLVSERNVIVGDPSQFPFDPCGIITLEDKGVLKERVTMQYEFGMIIV
ncbi:hypothetical protein HAX54_012746 [Datura stramonium]|uniref:Uncharacterized protein n=1 Tax=Datura stramonium TaxID=4076 RepID=A0ABS8TKA4_DATST|nr:hypothetical protein [Datura stramonium]